MNKEKLKHQLFIGKVTDVIGMEKTLELLKEVKDALKDIPSKKDKDSSQRVIEELEKLLENESNEWVDDEDGNEECRVGIVYSIRLRDRIKKLKQ